MNPFDLGQDTKSKQLPKRAPLNSSKQTTRHMDINDTQSIDGLAVHLQSPSIRRRYWNTRYEARYRQLTQLAQWTDHINTYLHDHKCETLAKVFSEDLEHYKQLKAMRLELSIDEESKMLSGLEQTLFHRARRLGDFYFKAWDKLRDRWNTSKSHRDDTLHPAARRALQHWLHQFTSDHKDDKNRMTPALVQDIYTLQNYL